MHLSPQQNLDLLKNAYVRLVLTLISFAVITVTLEVNVNSFFDKARSFDDILLGGSSLIVMISILFGIIIFFRKTRHIENLELEEKIVQYQSAMNVRARIIQWCGIFLIFCYVLCGSLVCLAEVIATIVLLFYFYPTNKRLSQEMKHNLEELERLQKK